MNKLIVIMLVLLVRSVNANSIIAMPTERGLAERIKLVIDRGYITNDRLKQTLFESSGSNSNLLVRAAKRLCTQYDSNTNPVPYHVLYLIGSFENMVSDPTTPLVLLGFAGSDPENGNSESKEIFRLT